MSYLKLFDGLKENVKSNIDQVDKSTALKLAAGGLIGLGLAYGL